MAILRKEERDAARARQAARYGRKPPKLVLDADYMQQFVDIGEQFVKLMAYQHVLERGTEFIDDGDGGEIEVPLGQYGIARINAAVNIANMVIRKAIPDLKSVEVSGQLDDGSTMSVDRAKGLLKQAGIDVAKLH